LHFGKPTAHEKSCATLVSSFACIKFIAYSKV
jgi:hypothetical protein